MKKLFALLAVLALLCGVAAAETVDTYTTASATKSVLSGDALAEAEKVLMAQSSLLSTADEAKAEGYQPKEGTSTAQIMSINVDGSIGLSTISEWKKKKINPSADKIMIICNVLSVTPEWLLSGIENTGRRGKKSSWYVIEKNSELGKLIANYNLLREKYRYQIKGYMDALKKVAD